mmetsp:Transcript_7840/g.32279  ORF Transcript_7840/g.32279 Transcript_7840/m.32279 type:complete len:294 (-) Transcript_7840:1336-2217(-)
MPMYKNSPYRTAIGISRSAGAMTIVRLISTCTSSGASLFSQTQITLVRVSPPTVISSTSDNARINCGECGSEPVIGGRPNSANTSVISAMTRKFWWCAGPLMSLFSGLFASRDDMFISTYIRAVRRKAGTMASHLRCAGPACRSTIQLPRPSAGSMFDAILSISMPLTLLPYAVSVPTAIAAATPKSAVSSRMVGSKNGDVLTCSAHKPNCRVSNARIKEKSACARSYSSDLKYDTSALPPDWMKMAETKNPKISCVNLVQLRSISVHASRHAMAIMNTALHIPVHANAVMNG